MRRLTTLNFAFVVAVYLLVSTSFAETIRQGKVLQVLHSEPYVYIEIKENSGKKVWVGVMATPVDVNDVIEFPDSPPMINFMSKPLKKHFKELIFASEIRIVWGKPKAAAAARPAALPAKPMETSSPTELKLENEHSIYHKETLKKIGLVPPSIENLQLFSGKYSYDGYTDPESNCLMMKSLSIGNRLNQLERYCTDNWERETIISANSIFQTGFSRDGKYFAASYDDKEEGNGVNIYRTSDMSILKELKYDRRQDKISFSPDTKYFATAGESGYVYVYDSNKWADVTKIKTEFKVNEILFSPDNSSLLIAEKNKISIYETVNFNKILQLDYDSNVWPVFDKATSNLIAWTERGNLTIYSTLLYNEIFRISDMYVDSYSFSPNGDYLAICSDKEVIIYNVATWKQVTVKQFDYVVRRVAFSKDGHTIAVGREPTSIIEVNTWKIIASVNGSSFLSGKSISGDFLINSSYPLNIYDASYWYLYYLISDLEKFENKEKAQSVLQSWKLIENNLAENIKELKRETSKKVSSKPDKSEFETVAEYSQRVIRWEDEQKENNDYNNLKITSIKRSAEIGRAHV